jgi:hypothetical protein
MLLAIMKQLTKPVVLAAAGFLFIVVYLYVNPATLSRRKDYRRRTYGA